jgi:metal-responsive CopG/Arc/MetJ family transcriptional regulator
MIVVKRTRFTIDLPDDLHKKLKAISAYEGTSMREVITGYLEDALRGKNAGQKHKTGDEDAIFKGSITMTS